MNWATCPRSRFEAAGRAKLAKFVLDVDWHRTHLPEQKRLETTEACQAQFWFCMLGGYSITYEINLVAHEMLSLKPGLTRAALLAESFVSDAEETLRALPIGPNNQRRLVSYRFPASKAKSLPKAAQWLETTGLWDLTKLFEVTSTLARERLLSCPGMGLKTASWFLRNIGHGKGLAIVDVHVARLATSLQLVPEGLDPIKDYLEFERLLCVHCSTFGFDVSELDLAMWHYSRGDFIEHRTGQRRLF